MNKLEQYITDRKSQFEEEPPAGYFERLQQKINRKSKRIILQRWSISIAASVAIMIVAGFLRYYAGKHEDKMLVCENSKNMKECYLSRMNVVAGQIEALSKNLDPWDQQQIMTDVQNIIEGVGSGLESEIPDELPANEAKLILSNYYRHNLESLEMIEKQLTINN